MTRVADMEILLTERDIHQRLRSMAEEITRVYSGRPLTIVAILTGSLVFLADLIRHLHFPHRIALLRASSYRGATTAPGDLFIDAEAIPDVRERDILVLDDILDSGRTLFSLTCVMREMGARSVRSAVLLWKQGRQEVEGAPDFCGFRIPNRFVVGYGLDYNDDYRHLPFLAVLPEAVRPSNGA